MIIEKLKEEIKLSVKRLYLPFILKINCKSCNRELRKSLMEDYLSHPIINCSENINFYCEDCNVEYQEKVKLTVKLEQV